MKQKGILIPADLHLPVMGVAPKNKKTFSLKELQKMVDGPIEIVHLDGKVVLVVNEEGKFRKDFLPNLQASSIYRAFHPQAEDYIVGNALLCPSNMID